MRRTYSLTGGDLKNLGGQTNGAFDTEILVLRAVHKITRDYSQGIKPSSPYTHRKAQLTLLQVRNISTRKRNPNLVQLGSDRRTSRVIILILRDVAHLSS